jgi:hypothetical protein
LGALFGASAVRTSTTLRGAWFLAFHNLNFTGSIVFGKPSQWFNPAAFIAPPSASGFYGNAGRDSLIGPGLGAWDFSVLKSTTIRERFQLQLRIEILNLINRANFNTPI